MFKLFTTVLITGMMLTACGKDKVGPTVYVPVQTLKEVTSDSSSISSIVAEENEYRLGLGQVPLAPGLTCSLYTNLSTALTLFPTSLPSATATFSYLGVFNQPNSPASDGLNVLPPALRIYSSWYAIRCSGQIVVTHSDYIKFEVESDDATNLYIDNVKVVNNDGNHGMVQASGTKYLKRGIHTFRLDYMQGPGGGQGLIVTSGGSVVPSNVFYR